MKNAGTDELRLEVATLEDTALNWAAAVFDRRSRGLTFAVVNGVVCGTYVNEQGKNQPCMCVHDMGWEAQDSAREALARERDLPSFAPCEFWQDCGPLIPLVNMSLEPDEGSLWRARVRHVDVVHELRRQPTALLAVTRAFVTAHVGTHIVVPPQLQEALASKSPRRVRRR